MRIRFRDTIITEDGPIAVGHIRDFPDDVAEGFIASGHAVRVFEGVEEATAPKAPEIAVSRKGKGR